MEPTALPDLRRKIGQRISDLTLTIASAGTKRRSGSADQKLKEYEVWITPYLNQAEDDAQIDGLRLEHQKEEWAHRILNAFWNNDLPAIVQVVKEMVPDMVQEMERMSNQERVEFMAKLKAADPKPDHAQEGM